MPKKISILLLIIAGSLVPLVAMAAQSTAPPPAAPAPRMKQYFFVLLRNGSNHTQSKEEAEKIQEGHMQHIRETAQSGKLQIAGPFDDDKGDWRGILIYDVKTADEARALCDADPAVKAGRLVCDIHAWWAQEGATLR
jgi:uncharacterized protein YciI